MNVGGRHKQEMYCIANPAIECDMSFKDKAEYLKQIWERICEKNTHIHKELDANVECFMKGVAEPKCTKSVANLMKEDKYDDMNDLQKEACRHFEETKECQLQSIIDNCGKNVATLYKTVFGPVADVERAVCDDVILPAEDHYYTRNRTARAIRPGIFGPMGHIFAFLFNTY
ncbi:hypothetical protein HNY73_017962 [Argiope bruennichi]|uniref:T20D4.11-like domain-containing protein n=1 Tax=Argiope bruennichi TaxID=94029 RepID=A0A8T0EBE2_ARGBR|nr:hypothetical protein HNY73_017962 [Argiope bruennichi]